MDVHYPYNPEWKASVSKDSPEWKRYCEAVEYAKRFYRTKEYRGIHAALAEIDRVCADRRKEEADDLKTIIHLVGTYEGAEIQRAALTAQ
ncbi:MAG: hypothetical protein ACYCZR_02100 [Burkholderiales bacterium]|jgi:hypothetical protein|nr:hypothetical protein [Sulfuricella sp.]PIQ12143.1 MAG: hypothetical protein COW70_10915 [Hydrogenophilales bacterium CG18_big_fil_WC_8_21_14_2_50_58_12]